MKAGLRQRLIAFLLCCEQPVRANIGNRELRKLCAQKSGFPTAGATARDDDLIDEWLGWMRAPEVSPPWVGEKVFPVPKPQTIPNFYESELWRRVRYDALKLYGGCCQCCGARATAGNPLHVDHIKPRSKYPHLELELSNLQVLCRDCNLGKGARDKTDWRVASRSCSSAVTTLGRADEICTRGPDKA